MDKTLEFERINSPRGTRRKDSVVVNLDKGIDHGAKVSMCACFDICTEMTESNVDPVCF